ncbi:hypothetical protein BDM02DRAFT_3196715 [Thelephora ganbajun]|uniref:Uncharacterized protein n=1 Tax=Thelephora ganbajun TaxID=370292 RepID=A0ACB6ZXL3_THEGA|nr:hypothetical protein BDM02DRAFT_3196715 [Thelephora ganbajun]
MHNPSIRVQFGQVDGPYTFSGFEDEIGQQLMDYISFRQGAYSSYHTADDHIQAFQETMARSAHYVQHELPTSVLRTRDDYQSTLELALREWTGYGTPENRDSALERWSFLASSAANIPRRIKAQAHSCLAVDPESWNIDSVYRAGSNANEAISLGLISPGALRAGFSIEHLGFRRPGDNRFPGLDTDRFERLIELWEAIDIRTAEMDRATAKRDAKISKAPLKYVCSAEDCGIQATKKSGLLRCGGKCPAMFKPSYCSKECQKMDWKRHKPFCKAGAAKSSVHSLNTNNDTSEKTVQRSTTSEDMDSDKFEGRTPGHSIDVAMRDGGTMRLNSRTLGPKMMREFRKIAEDDNR